jgi:CheY-like chemotaxis protein
MDASPWPGRVRLALVVRHDRRAREDDARHFAQGWISSAEAQDGLHGIARAATLLPDVIAVDFGMCQRDVADMCVRLKAQDSTGHIPIVGIAGTASEVEQATAAGCVSVLTKPCSPYVLLAEIRRVLALPID